MRFPWTRPTETAHEHDLETRQEQTDTVLAALIQRGGASGGQSLAAVHATAALESAAGLTGRSFASAEVTGPGLFADAVTPAVLEIIGRELIRRGNSVWLIDTTDGLKLLPAQSFDVDGPPDPRLWDYRITVGGPSFTQTSIHVPSAGVLHFRYAVDPGIPWRGRSPVEVASDSGRLSAETVLALGDEMSGPRGSLLGIPIDGQDSTVTNLRADIKTLKGRTLLLETGDWGGAAGGGQMMMKAERLGATMPASTIELAKHASAEVYSACGFSPAIFASDAAPAALREANRLALGTVAALGKLVQAELKEKLDPELRLSWAEIRSTDIQTRTRSVKQLVDAGLTIKEAMAVAGLEVPARKPNAYDVRDHSSGDT